MAIDYRWMSQGGLLLDGTGDISFTANGLETIVSMVRSRLKAAVDGYKLYTIGCGLDSFRGSTSDADTEAAIIRQVQSQLTTGFLPTAALTVNSLVLGEEIQVFVFLQNQLIATTTVTIG